MAKTFYVSRISINGNYDIMKDGYTIKEKIIMETLSNNTTWDCLDRTKKHIYKFLNITKFKSEQLNDTVIHGILSRSNKSYEIVNEESNTIEEESTNKSIVHGKYEFFIILKSGLIFYTPQKDFNKDSFNNIFLTLFKHNATDELYEIAIGTVNRTASILDNLKQLKQVSTIEIRLLPSNPNYSDDWREEDEDIKRINAKSATHIYTSTSGSGLSIGNTLEEVKQTRCGKQLLMAEDGYGNAVCKGINYQNKKETLKNNKFQESIPGIPNDIDTGAETPKNKFNWVYNAGLNIINRFIGEHTSNESNT